MYRSAETSSFARDDVEGAGPAALVDDRAALLERRQRKGVDAPAQQC